MVVSETGLVYTFTTAKLQPLVTQPEGKNLIQACLNAPHGSLPSSMPVGAPLNRASGPMNMGGPPPGSNNLPGGLSISGAPAGNQVKEDHDGDDDDEAAHGGRASAGDKRRRRVSSATNPRGATSPHTPNASVPPPLSIPPPGPGQPNSAQPHTAHPQQAPPPQISLGSPTSPQQQHSQVTASSPQAYSANSYHPAQQHHHQTAQHDMYGGHTMPPGGYQYPGLNAPQGGPGQPLGGLAAAAAQHGHGHWPPAQQQVQQGGHYGRR